MKGDYSTAADLLVKALIFEENCPYHINIALTQLNLGLVLNQLRRFPELSAILKNAKKRLWASMETRITFWRNLTMAWGGL